MADIKPKGEKMRQAVKWISDRLKSGQDNCMSSLVTKASLKYNLSPKEEDYLLNFYKSDSREDEK